MAPLISARVLPSRFLWLPEWSFIHIASLTFLFFLGESVSPAKTCYFGPEFMKQIPRVWHYVRRAWGTNGGRLVLPCRVLDQDADVTTVWHFRGAPILPGLSNYKYEVRAVEALGRVAALR